MSRTESLARKKNAICHLGHNAILLKIGNKVLIKDYPYSIRSYAVFT